MSKRIHEIAEQFNNQIDPGNHFANQQVLEQLVEAVVRECSDVIARDVGSGMDHSDFSDGMTWGLRVAINSIKEHFEPEKS